MAVYRFQIENSTVAEICQPLTAFGRIIGLDADGIITYDIEATDLWEAAERVAEVKGDLDSMSLRSDWNFGKPVEVIE